MATSSPLADVPPRRVDGSAFARITLLGAVLTWAVLPLHAQDGVTIPKPPWADSLRYGGGPSFGAPEAEFDGKKPVAQWCLGPSPWWRASEGWLRQVLSDTSEHGHTWRRVLGNAPTIAATDSIRVVTQEARCVALARLIHRGLLGWPEGPPPIFLADLPTAAQWPGRR